MRKSVQSGILAIIGFILSPLSWWNDPIVNIPLAYLFSIPFTMISDRLFLPSLIAGYWLTNVAGLLLIHKGLTGLRDKPAAKWNWKHDALVTSLYTCILLTLVLKGWLKTPWSYFK